LAFWIRVISLLRIMALLFSYAFCLKEHLLIEEDSS
jgi:hypothetical protein